MNLLEAVTSGDADAVVEALEAATDVNQQDEHNRTALVIAATMGRDDLCELLLAAGVEPMLTDDEQETALLKAAANGHAAVVQRLMPLAGSEEQGLASAFLKAYGKSHAPEYHAPNSNSLEAKVAKKVGELTRSAAELSARAADFVGNSDPARRMARIARAEARRKRR